MLEWAARAPSSPPQQDGVRPDMVLDSAKGLGARLPAHRRPPRGGESTRRSPPGTGFFQHGHTYMGHPAACAGGNAAPRRHRDARPSRQRERHGGAAGAPRSRPPLRTAPQRGGHPRPAASSSASGLCFADLGGDEKRRFTCPGRRPTRRSRRPPFARDLMVYPHGRRPSDGVPWRPRPPRPRPSS